MRRREISWLRSALGLPLALLLGAALLAVPSRAALALDTAPADEADRQGLRLLEQESKARAEIVKRVAPSVVNISVEKKASASDVESNGEPSPFDDPFFQKFFRQGNPAPRQGRRTQGLGTGIIVDSNGYVLTNNHVIAQADKITVKLRDGREFAGKLVGADPASDLAVVRVNGKDLPKAQLGNSDDLQVGESVLAIGNPFGLEQTITAGIVSAKGRNAVGVADYENFIQTDASINPGNSGGPLLNLKGEVVGVNTAIYGNSGGNMGIGFAIPINQARQAMAALIADGKVVRGFLGVVIQDLTPDLAGAMNLAQQAGVLVAGIQPDSPAAKAGMKQGDVVQTFQDRPVKSVNELRYAVAAVKPGETVPAGVWRDGKPMRLQILVTEQPQRMLAANAAPDAPETRSGQADLSRKVLGMTVQTLTRELAASMGQPEQQGVLIARVEDDGPAAGAGLSQGMLILEVDHHPVRSAQEVMQLVEHLPAKKYVLLLIRMNNAERFVAVKKP